MFRIHPRTLLKAALLPTALLMAAGGSQAAFASQAATTANVTSGIRSAPSPDSYYTMRLSPSSVTVRAGYRTRITVSFHATADLYGTPVALSISGLPDGVTASFSPRTATIGGRSVLTLTAAPSSVAGPFAITVTAITLSSDPIGTSAPLGLTISTQRLFSTACQGKLADGEVRRPVTWPGSLHRLPGSGLSCSRTRLRRGTAPAL